MVPAIATLVGCLMSLPPGLPRSDDPGPTRQPDPRSVVVASGDVDSTWVVLWAQPTVAGDVTIVWSTEPDLDPRVGEQTLAADVFQPAKIVVGDLLPATQYYFSATDAAGASAQGRFRTAAPVGQRRGLHFGVTGDWRGELAPYPAIHNVPSADLDFYVALGDTIYADIASPAVPLDQCLTLQEFLAKHDEVYQSYYGAASNAAVRASTAWFSMIDDHEVTNDFAGGAPPSSDERFAEYDGDYINETALFEYGLAAFHAFHPICDEYYGDTGDPRTAFKRKLYRYRTFGSDAALILVDARSFRDEGLPSVLEIGVEKWLEASFNPARTMLGAAPLAELQADLLAAQQAGITWKFVIVPEPIQNLGPFAGEDRFEGYAFERSQLLGFIDQNQITNVVFIAADIHCTIVNNLTYQVDYGQPQLPIASWEVTTGSVAFAPPFGPVLMDYVALVPVLGPILNQIYDSLDRAGQDRMITRLIDTLLESGGYDAIGLARSGLPARRTLGQWVAVNTYGWTAFAIDRDTQRLTVSTYGIDWYDEDDLADDPDGVLSRTPELLSQFIVDPTGP